MNVYPSLEELLKGEDSTNLLEARRSLRSILSNLVLFFFTVFAVYILNYFFADVGFPESIPVLRHFSLRWLGIIPLAILLEIIRKYHDDLYVFGLHHIKHLEGRLSLTSSVPLLKYTDIRSIEVKQDIIGRIFDYGNVLLSSAGQSDVELTITGIRSPRQLAALVEELRTNSTEVEGT